MGAQIIHIAWQCIYAYEGWEFDYDRRKPLGPWPLKKDGEPRARAGRKFYSMFARFNALPVEQQEEYRVF
jgi:hypothetical protein